MINFFSGERTTYTITDERGEESSITVEKWVADLLQANLPDVHAWIQQMYDSACAKLPHLTRREKGNAVRARARQEAERCPGYVSPTELL